MCDRVLVLESGRLNYDSKVVEGGSVDGGIHYLQYDDATRRTEQDDRRRARRRHLSLGAPGLGVIAFPPELKIQPCNSLSTPL